MADVVGVDAHGVEVVGVGLATQRQNLSRRCIGS